MTVSSLTTAASATTTTASTATNQPDYPVNRIRMGRRKQNCPQKTGLTASGDGEEENGVVAVKDAGDEDRTGGSDSASVASGISDREAVTMPTLESLEPDSNDSLEVRAKPLHGLLQPATAASLASDDRLETLNLLSANSFFKLSHPGLMSPPSSGDDPMALLKTLPLLAKSSSSSQSAANAAAAASELDALNMLKNSQFFNPALLALNPSLYAVHLAQLQAAQLLSQSGLSSAGSSLISEDSRKRKNSEADEGSSNSAAAVAAMAALAGGNGALNLSKHSPDSSPKRSSAESPLDLSGSRKAMSAFLDGASVPKMPKYDDSAKFSFPWAAAGLQPFLGPLLGNLTPEALARINGLSSLVSAASGFSAATSPPPLMSSPSSMMGRSSGGMSDIKNPLERMSEIAKTGGAATATSPSANRPNLGGRHSAWQSQWINRGPETNKEVFKCVWCKESFTSLNALTVHMKETKHFGGAVPPTSPIPPQSIRPPHPSPQKSPPTMSSSPQQPPQGMNHGGGGGGGGQGGTPKTNRDILKEHLPLPRKLVRGQDVWLGRGEQQTKDILKCMWCGESFRSLDIMTKHMQETKHYTKVISQEQLMSWKAPETGNGSNQNHVNAVLTCKVCEQGFSSLKDLSDHMVKNNHFNKEGAVPAGRPPGPPSGPGVSPTPSPSAAPGAGAAAAAAAAAGSLGQQSKEKRKKSLPVRKLLELERAQQELSGHFKGSSFGDDGSDVQPGKISCERCGDKIPMLLFVDHIRQCVGPMTSLSSSRSLSGGTPRPPSGSSASTPDFAAMTRLLTASSAMSPPANAGKLGSMFGKKTPPASQQQQPQQQESPTAEEPKSILGSLERMVQNNFGAKKKAAGPDTNMSILQRLGIDEGVDYTKPLMDPTGALFRSAGLQGLFPGSLGGHRGPSASSHSNSSACSSPDRFKCERSASIKSENSAAALSPNPADESRSRSPLPVVVKKETKKSESDEEDADDVTSPPKKLKLETSDDDDDVIKKEDEDGDEDEAKSDTETELKPSTDNNNSSSNNNNRHSASPASSRHSLEENGSKVLSSPIGHDDDEDEVKSTSSKATANNDNDTSNVEEASGDKTKKKSHPLAALQMLCDKTEKKSAGAKHGGVHGHGGSHGSSSSTGLYGGPSVDPGAILAFSWACNQAVVNDSLLKCPFCDTPFISKGAYRHHLSKMHFVKDGAGGGDLSGKGFIKTPEKSPGVGGGSGSQGEGGAGGLKEENAQSKFQKYSQLAKQLSCSGQP